MRSFLSRRAAMITRVDVRSSDPGRGNRGVLLVIGLVATAVGYGMMIITNR
jgi:hypothetical protein